MRANKSILSLSLTSAVLAVSLMAKTAGPIEPQLENRALHRWANLIVAQPRSHRDAIVKIGAPLAPVLVDKLQQCQDSENPLLQNLLAKLHQEAPAMLQRFLPEPMSNELRTLNAIRALAYLGPPAAGATRALIPFLQDERFASDAAHALASIGPEAKDAMPALVAALDDQVPWAATALANMGSTAASAIPALGRARANAIEEGSGWFRREVEKALERIRTGASTVERRGGIGERNPPVEP